MAKYDLSIVVPAYNEAHRIERLLVDLDEFRRSFPGELEILVSDDGSTDETIAVVERCAAALDLKGVLRVVRAPENRGKGHAVRQGILACSGRLALFCDADGATPMREFYRLKEQIDAGFDVAVGSRDAPGAKLVVPQPVHRRLMGAAMRFLVRALLVRGIYDTQCGFKLFTAAAARAVFERQHLDGFSFDVELLFLADRLGFKIAEVPIEWHDQPGSKVDIFRAPPAMLRDLCLIRLRHRGIRQENGRRSEAVRW